MLIAEKNQSIHYLKTKEEVFGFFFFLEDLVLLWNLLSLSNLLECEDECDFVVKV